MIQKRWIFVVVAILSLAIFTIRVVADDYDPGPYDSAVPYGPIPGGGYHTLSIGGFSEGATPGTPAHSWNCLWEEENPTATFGDPCRDVTINQSAILRKEFNPEWRDFWACDAYGWCSWRNKYLDPGDRIMVSTFYTDYEDPEMELDQRLVIQEQYKRGAGAWTNSGEQNVENHVHPSSVPEIFLPAVEWTYHIDWYTYMVPIYDNGFSWNSGSGCLWTVYAGAAERFGTCREIYANDGTYLYHVMSPWSPVDNYDQMCFEGERAQSGWQQRAYAWLWKSSSEEDIIGCYTPWGGNFCCVDIPNDRKGNGYYFRQLFYGVEGGAGQMTQTGVTFYKVEKDGNNDDVDMRMWLSEFEMEAAGGATSEGLRGMVLTVYDFQD